MGNERAAQIKPSGNGKPDRLPANTCGCIVPGMNPADRFDILVHAQPWQGLLLDAEQIADLAGGELGAGGVTLSVKAAEPQDAVAISPAEDLIAVRLAAGSLFAPDPEQYASTRLRPQVSPTVKGRGPVGRLAEVCRDRSLRLRLRISALRDAAVAARHGDAVSTNALGLPLGNCLCPSNPDVVELVRCQILDATAQFEPDGIELENVARPDRYEPTEPAPGRARRGRWNRPCWGSASAPRAASRRSRRGSTRPWRRGACRYT